MKTSIKLLISSLLAVLVVPMFAATQAGASTTSGAVAAAPAPVLAAAKASGHVSIPKNYVYNPKAKKQKTLHDYCTKSPDSFSAPGKNADFRGPCARHDLCIQHKTKKRSSCDADLLSNMKSECKYTYGTFDARRYPCLSTAATYWAVVRVKTVFS
ncbi:hypothetical protein D1871_07380 [Nakamurella silvestris]|nr:hypothetical protein D1871_07380 [Nakamurella silvestris]